VNTLLLWDIDGTLLNTHGAGVRALQRALLRGFGVAGSISDIDYSGRTDGWIIRQILAKFSLPVTGETLSRMADGYVAALPAELAGSNVHLLAGIPGLLEDARARGNVALGLLTGNLRRGAEAKLNSRKAWHYFPFGAFADDSEDRNELGPHALRRARVHHGVDFAPGNVWVIGDTPHDVTCARAFGARAIAVATGRHSSEQLRAAQADAVFEDLGDPGRFWSTVDGGQV
jgi:phosphoglycolate phosphatase-like HAD superfamily hydrolase